MKIDFEISSIVQTQSITEVPRTRPFCLSPILIVGTCNEGASISPEDEFPSKPTLFFINAKYSSGFTEVINLAEFISQKDFILLVIS
ncbi:hypothetical protein D3C86_1181780 [compost metagenome]